jgi:transposase
MDMAKRAEGFREAVAKLGQRGRTTPYPKKLRDEAVDYARERREQGTTWRLVAGELGIGIDSLTNWARLAERRGAKPEFRQVALKQAEVAVSGPGGALVVHGPGGVRVEGLDVAGLAELMRRLS